MEWTPSELYHASVIVLIISVITFIFTVVSLAFACFFFRANVKNQIESRVTNKNLRRPSTIVEIHRSPEFDMELLSGRSINLANRDERSSNAEQQGAPSSIVEEYGEPSSNVEEQGEARSNLDDNGRPKINMANVK